ncbi:hypothetical protein [Rickettsiales endosymbiont of Stachyamoeba lipophora]|uniref:hypothetical protein n=1 Tax=Rickettsiales endosymbiont of Stachyamoeba lipophora TaxID=2486578 RepID=UPI000F64B633|nr:hypothetical protein [Rickettsiales endosymbiont of Stachyamoeba lipophora]AZL15156.1 hypothetical protein EF513_01085 [Rickettsiales endosymbiont of Stachyamoeba lipophora]
MAKGSKNDNFANPIIPATDVRSKAQKRKDKKAEEKDNNSNVAFEGRDSKERVSTKKLTATERQKQNHIKAEQKRTEDKARKLTEKAQAQAQAQLKAEKKRAEEERARKLTEEAQIQVQRKTGKIAAQKAKMEDSDNKLQEGKKKAHEDNQKRINILKRTATEKKQENAISQQGEIAAMGPGKQKLTFATRAKKPTRGVPSAITTAKSKSYFTPGVRTKVVGGFTAKVIGGRDGDSLKIPGKAVTWKIQSARNHITNILNDLNYAVGIYNVQKKQFELPLSGGFKSGWHTLKSAANALKETIMLVENLTVGNLSYINPNHQPSKHVGQRLWEIGSSIAHVVKEFSKATVIPKIGYELVAAITKVAVGLMSGVVFLFMYGVDKGLIEPSISAKERIFKEAKTTHASAEKIAKDIGAIHDAKNDNISLQIELNHLAGSAGIDMASRGQ